MCGSNSLPETDRRPPDACPECTAKICWATGAGPRERYSRLAEFLRAQGFTHEAHAFESRAAALSKI